MCGTLGCPVEDFSRSFADSRALCLLASYYLPELLPSSRHSCTLHQICTLNPALYTLHTYIKSAPHTLQPSSNLNLNPPSASSRPTTSLSSSLRQGPTPYTLHLTPYNLHPTPQILLHTPEKLKPQSALCLLASYYLPELLPSSRFLPICTTPLELRVLPTHMLHTLGAWGTLHPTPHTSHLTPHTLNPTPYTCETHTSTRLIFSRPTTFPSCSLPEGLSHHILRVGHRGGK